MAFSTIGSILFLFYWYSKIINHEDDELSCTREDIHNLVNILDHSLDSLFNLFDGDMAALYVTVGTVNLLENQATWDLAHHEFGCILKKTIDIWIFC